MREKRFSGRLSVNLSAELWDVSGADVLCKARLIELSSSGVKIYFEKQELSIPADVKIKFGLEKAIPFFFEAEIVWSSKVAEKTFAGVKFKNLNMINREKIRKYIYDLKYEERYTM